MGLKVPELERKLQMLIGHGLAADKEDLAEKLGGLRPNTLKWWKNGDAARAPETVSAPAVPKLLDIIQQALPDLTLQQVRQVLLGPADDLKLLLAGPPAPTIAPLIEREADFAAGRLITEDLLLVRRRDRSPQGAEHRTALGQGFRIEFATTSRAGFAVALQSGPGGWGMVPCAVDAPQRRLLLPGLDEDGQPDWMVEENEAGRHRFIAAQGNRAFPPELSAALADRLTLDRTLIAHFLRSFEAQDKFTRRLFALDVDILRSPASAPAQS